MPASGWVPSRGALREGAVRVPVFPASVAVATDSRCRLRLRFVKCRKLWAKALPVNDGVIDVSASQSISLENLESRSSSSLRAGSIRPLAAQSTIA
jgi:hypothetical protein